MTTTRREFLKSASLGTGVAVLSMYVPGMGGKEAQAAGSMHTPNVWVHIADDNTITLISHMSEMGQGVHTSLPMLIAEELNVDINKVKVTTAPADPAYVNGLLGAQITGGSTSIRDAWEKLRIGGAQVRTMSALEHDSAFAAVSHLPHMLAFAAMNAVNAQAQAAQFLSLAGPGFRDFTRIAASDPAVWRDILQANRDQLLLQSQHLREALQAFETALAQGDSAALQALITAASQSRAAWSLKR